MKSLLDKLQNLNEEEVRALSQIINDCQAKYFGNPLKNHNQEKMMSDIFKMKNWSTLIANAQSVEESYTTFCLSTGNISEETCNTYLPKSKLIKQETEYGWRLYCACKDYLNEHKDEMPQELRIILFHAHEKGFKYVEFDMDAPESHRFMRFDW